MKIIIASDIHGINAPLRSLLAALGDPIILSPWPEDGCPFASEEDAVAAFHAKNGLAAYEQKIADRVEDQPAFLIGFSVGAASLWRYIASERCAAQSRAFLYYGSRIRDAIGLTPRCPADVVFAEHEPSFSPRAVAASIARPGVACSVIDGTRHGFMNPSSMHYRHDIASQQIALLLGAIREEAAT